MDKPNRIRVRFAVEDDEEARKITALLEALGYEAVRELDHGSPQTRLRWALSRLSAQAKLTDRERDILHHVLRGSPNQAIGDELGISKATVKWHMHNIFTKTGASTREELLRVALQLGGVQPKTRSPRPRESEAGSDASEAAPAREVAPASEAESKTSEAAPAQAVDEGPDSES